MKPLTELTPDDISIMSETDFTALLLVVGPVRPPRGNETYLHNDDFERIWEFFGMYGHNHAIAISQRLGFKRDD